MDNPKSPKDRLLEMSKKVDDYDAQIAKILAEQKEKVDKLRKQKRALQNRIGAEERKRRTHAMILIGTGVNAIYKNAGGDGDIVGDIDVQQLVSKLQSDKYVVDLIAHYQNPDYQPQQLLSHTDAVALKAGRMLMTKIGGNPDWQALQRYLDQYDYALARLRASADT